MRRWNIIFSGLVIAVVLTGAGLAFNYKLRFAPSEVANGRLLVTGVRGLSWEQVLQITAQGRMPVLNGLCRGISSKGDIISTGYHSDIEVLASIITGTFSRKHGISSRVKAGEFDGNENMAHRAVWDVMNRSGLEVGVVGFPLWYPLKGNGSLVIPDWRTISEEFFFYRDGKKLSGVDEWPDLLLTPDQVPRSDVDDVAGGVLLPAGPDLALRECLAADLTMVQAAVKAFTSSDDVSVFLYLEGLHKWESYLNAHPQFFADSRRVEDLRAGYYDFIDQLLMPISQLADSRTSLVLFSEQGDRGGTLAYRSYFPKLDQYPPIGFFLACGYAVKEGVMPHIITPVDMAATMLYLTGTPIPNHLDGLVLFGLLDDDYFFKHKLSFSR